MNGLEMDEPKDNLVSLVFECEDYKDNGDCVYFSKSYFDELKCKYKNGSGRCTSQLAQVNRMVVDLKQRGIK